MGSVTFQFAGICTHFRFGVVAGVPHRVVLPDASKFLTGFLTVNAITPPTPPPPLPEPVLYYITPHFPQLELALGPGPIFGPPDPVLSERLTIPPTPPHLIKDGYIGSGVRLQVANPSATERKMTYDGDIPALKTFVPDYNLSSDVVLNGRAACYVDLYGGHQTVTEQGSTKPPIVRISVRTEGPPVLLVSSLLSSSVTGQPGQSFLLPLSDEDVDLTLIVENLENRQEELAEQGAGEYDWLLHYLTAKGGIPQVIQVTENGFPPGMPNPLQSATPTQIGNSLIRLGKALDPGIVTRRRLIPHFDTTPACSDSQYP